MRKCSTTRVVLTQAVFATLVAGCTPVESRFPAPSDATVAWTFERPLDEVLRCTELFRPVSFPWGGRLYSSRTTNGAAFTEVILATTHAWTPFHFASGCPMQLRASWSVRVAQASDGIRVSVLPLRYDVARPCRPLVSHHFCSGGRGVVPNHYESSLIIHDIAVCLGGPETPVPEIDLPNVDARCFTPP